MFREVARKKQAMTREECVAVLVSEKRGVLSVLGDDGYPYGLPINHWYDEKTGHIFFHSGKVGHKVDAIARNDKVSLCVYDEGASCDGDWSLRFKSVIVFGRIKPVTDEAAAMEAARQLSYKFTRDEAYIADEIQKFGANTLVLELIPEHITGKRVHEA